MPFVKLRGKIYDLHAPLIGARAIAEVRGQTERQAFHCALAGKFKFRKDGKSIVSTPYEVLLPLLGEEGIARLIVAEPVEAA
jgi:hypothetical protein